MVRGRCGTGRLHGLAAALELSRASGRRSMRIAAATLKAIGFAALLLCLVEPLLTGSNRSAGPMPSSSWPTTARACSSATARCGHPRRLAPRAARQGVAVEDPARAGFRRPPLRLRLAPPRRGGLRRARVRRRRLVADDRAAIALEAVPRPAACRRAGLHRRQPDRRGRHRLVAAPADLSRRAPVAGRRPGHRRPGRLDQPDQLRVGAGRCPRRRLGGRLPRRDDRRRRHR